MGAKVKMMKGTITLSRGIDPEEGKMFTMISADLQPKIHLGGNHHVNVPLAQRDQSVKDSELSAEGQAALKLVMDEVEGKIRAKACEKAEQFAKETGIKLEG